MILRALIIDDEPLAHKIILEYASSTPYLDIVGQCHLATEAMVFFQQHEVDLIFLDIQMPKLKGLDFLRTLAHRPLVVITSAYEEYALESFELAVCDYLLKPFRFDRFLKAVNRAIELKQMQMPTALAPKVTPASPVDDQLFIKSDKRLFQLNISDIYFLESYGNYVKVWLEDEFYLTPRTLSSFEEQMPSGFHRIHKSYIINKKHIDYIEGNQVMMKNKKSIPVGKNHRQNIKGFLGYKN